MKVVNPFYLCFLMGLSISIDASAQNISFADPQDISNGSVDGVSALDVADFNNDGLIDVAVMEGGAHSKGMVTFAWFQQTAKSHGFVMNWEIPKYLMIS